MPLILLAIGGFAVVGYFTDKFGEGINDASNGLIKVGVAGVAGFVVLKKMKVIK